MNGAGALLAAAAMAIIAFGIFSIREGKRPK